MAFATKFAEIMAETLRPECSRVPTYHVPGFTCPKCGKQITLKEKVRDL